MTMLSPILRHCRHQVSNLHALATVDVQARTRFRCNVCGSGCIVPTSKLSREQQSCSFCGSSVRQRSLMCILSLELFGSSLALRDFPVRPDLVGLDMSGAINYADRLQQKLSFTNTYLHKEPQLDITVPNPSWFNRCDFVISSDVFEHVAPPVYRAFDNTLRLLKPGGVFVLTVPYIKTGVTVEHFPELYDWRIERTATTCTLLNTTADGRSQRFGDLVFHGGEGETLEVRIFSQEGVLGELRRAGFTDIHMHGEPFAEFGIVWPDDWSLPITARKPEASKT
jgi:SAM-dependent methyltransferase